MKKNSFLKHIYYPFLSHRAKTMTRLIQKHIQNKAKILDVGCGNMLISKRLKQNCNSKVQGIDVIDMNLTNLPFQLFNGHNIPYKNNSFDISLLLGVLHHVENQKTLLNEVKRVTKSKIIIFEDIFYSDIEKIWLKIRDYIGNVPEESNMNFAFNFKNLNQWKNIFKSFDLKVTQLKVLFNHFRLTHHAIFVLKK